MKSKLLPSILIAILLAAGTAARADVLTLKNRRELFVDDFFLERVAGLEYRLGVPQPAGTALKLGRPWEGRFGAYLSVISDGRKFQLYYRGGSGAKDNGDLTCYAESTDGVHWDRPNLGLFEIDGTKDNNVILPPHDPTWVTHNFCAMYDARPGVPPDERYKAVGGRPVNFHGQGWQGGLHRLVSADGIHWRLLPGEPLFTGYALDSQNVLAWLPDEQCYAIYLRTWTGDRKGEKFKYNSVRTIARTTSKDFVHWSEPERMIFDQGGVENLYTNATQPYFRAPQILIAMPFRFVPDRQVLDQATLKEYDIERTMWKGVSDAVLLTSRGGIHYQRKFMESFVRPGIDPSSWAARSNMPGLGVFQTGPNEMSFLIVRGYSSNRVRFERMVLRLDGFASLHAGYETGTAVTRPVVVDGARLSLNLSTSANGYAKVVVTDEQGGELTGFTEADAKELVGDSVDLTAGWKGGARLESLRGRTVRLKFILRDADLYSIAVMDR